MKLKKKRAFEKEEFKREKKKKKNFVSIEKHLKKQMSVCEAKSIGTRASLVMMCA